MNGVSRGKNMSKFWANRFGSKLSHKLTSRREMFHRCLKPANSSPEVSQRPWPVQTIKNHVQIDEIQDNHRTDLACFALSGTVGIVDLGASRTVVGSQQVKEILAGVPDHKSTEPAVN